MDKREIKSRIAMIRQNKQDGKERHKKGELTKEAFNRAMKDANDRIAELKNQLNQIP